MTHHVTAPSQSRSAHLTHSKTEARVGLKRPGQSVCGATGSCVRSVSPPILVPLLPQPSLGSPTNRLFGCCQQSIDVCILQDARVVVPPQRLIAPEQQCSALLHQEVGVCWAQLTPCISRRRGNVCRLLRSAQQAASFKHQQHLKSGTHAAPGPHHAL